MKVILILSCLILFFVIIISYIHVQKEHYRNYLDYKSKCFDCEKEIRQRYGDDVAWLANPSKMFSTEIDGIRQANGDISGGFLGKSIRYF